MRTIDNLSAKKEPFLSNGQIVDLKKIASFKKAELEAKKEQEEKNRKIETPKEKIPEKVIFWWTAQAEENARRHSVLWYATTFIIILAVTIFSIVQKNWLFLIFIILAIFIYLTMSRRHTDKGLFRITDKGLEIDERKYNFPELKSFALNKKNGKNYLMFETNRIMEKILSVPIKKDLDKIANYLKKYLPEKEYQESFIDTLKDFLGF